MLYQEQVCPDITLWCVQRLSIVKLDSHSNSCNITLAHLSTSSLISFVLFFFHSKKKLFPAPGTVNLAKASTDYHLEPLDAHTVDDCSCWRVTKTFRYRASHCFQLVAGSVQVLMIAFLQWFEHSSSDSLSLQRTDRSFWRVDCLLGDGATKLLFSSLSMQETKISLAISSKDWLFRLCCSVFLVLTSMQRTLQFTNCFFWKKPRLMNVSAYGRTLRV